MGFRVIRTLTPAVQREIIQRKEQEAIALVLAEQAAERLRIDAIRLQPDTPLLRDALFLWHAASRKTFIENNPGRQYDMVAAKTAIIQSDRWMVLKSGENPVYCVDRFDPKLRVYSVSSDGKPLNMLGSLAKMKDGWKSIFHKQHPSLLT